MRPRPMIAPDDAPRRRGADGGAAADAELFRLIADGSEVAFRALFARYGGAVYRACREIVRDPELAEDAAQEAFVRVWRAAATVDPRRGAPAAWLMTTARNAARNVVRVRVPQPGEVEDAADQGDAGSEVLDRLWVHGALSRLTGDERVVVELAYFEDLTHRQISERLDQPLGTVKTRLRRALNRLADEADPR